MSTQHPAIPVLMYHHVNPAGNFINVGPETFELQMRYLKEKGFTAIHAGEFSGILSGKAPAPRKPVMITFDVGWLDNWVFAFPVLKQYGMKAVVFLIASRVAPEGKDRGRMKASPPLFPPIGNRRALLKRAGLMR